MFFPGYRCEKCKLAVTGSSVKELNETLVTELKSIDRSDPDVLDGFLKKHAATLPDSHQMSREIQYGQLMLFKSVDDADLMDTNTLLKKSCFCKQLLDLADKIEPGLTKWRGELMFEMQATTVVLTQRALNEGRIKGFQAQEILKECLDQLKEAIVILQVEPEGKDKLQTQMATLSQLLQEVEE